MVSLRGKTIQIVANPDYRTRFAFLKSFEPGTGKPVYYCEGEESYHEIAKDQSERAVVPGDCAYLYVENYGTNPNTYELYRSTSLTATGWSKVGSFSPPPGGNCRHGCVIRIDEKTYRRLQAAY